MRGWQTDSTSGVQFQVDAGPPRRVAFLQPGSILDNWEGVVYDPSGRVATATGWRKGIAGNHSARCSGDPAAAIAEALKKTGGSTDPEKMMAAFQGMKLTSPRGPIMIDADTRDIVQPVYIRRVEKVNGQLVNVEFDKFPDVKDPGK